MASPRIAHIVLVHEGRPNSTAPGTRRLTGMTNPRHRWRWTRRGGEGRGSSRYLVKTNELTMFENIS